MLPRLTSLLCLIGLAVGGLLLPSPAAVADDPGIVSGPSGNHRLFFANAQRQSLTGTASARARMRKMTTLLRRSHADLGVLVELQDRQPGFFRSATRGEWELVASSDGIRNGVIYDRSVWRVVGRDQLRTFGSHGQRARTPIVTLQDNDGYRVTVIPVHNPRNSTRLRTINNRRVLAAAARLERAGTPVLIAGDFNAGRAVTCLYTSRKHRMVSAAHPRGNACRKGGAHIDQAFATQGAALFRYRRRFTHATDHRFVYSVGFRVLTRTPTASAV